MSLFLTLSDLIVDEVYQVTEYRKYLANDDYYAYIIKMVKVADSTIKYMKITDGAIFKKLSSGNLDRFNIKKSEVDIGNGTDYELVIIGETDWTLLV